MNLRKYSIKELYEGEKIIKGKLEKVGPLDLRNNYQFRLRKIKDRVGIHLNKRLWNMEFKGENHATN